MAIAPPKLLLRSWAKSWGFWPPLGVVVMAAADAKELLGFLPLAGTSACSTEQGLSSHAGNEGIKEVASCGGFAAGALSFQ